MMPKHPRAPAVRGKLIIFEGPDGVGKSKLVQTLANRLRTMRIRHEVVSTSANSIMIL
jgi:thymidylate kinase